MAAFKGRRFPLRAYGGVWAGQLRWGRLTHARVLGVLSNPSYAGTYVFGRYHSHRVVEPTERCAPSSRTVPRRMARRHPRPSPRLHLLGRLPRQPGPPGRQSHQRRGPAATRGLALCQGIITCGSCGRPMSTRYHRNGHAAYECSASRADHMATATCRSITAATVDEAVAERLLDALNPEEVALALAAADEVSDRRARRSRASELAVERARYEAERAERAFHACEPENRLVARSLEARWEQRLAALADTEKSPRRDPDRPPAAAVAGRSSKPSPKTWPACGTQRPPPPGTANDSCARSSLMSPFWPNRTSPRHESGSAGIPGRPTSSSWPAAKTYSVSGPTPPPSNWPAASESSPTTRSPERLNAAGYMTGAGRHFDRMAVANMRHYHHIPQPGLLKDGETTVAEVARRFAISHEAVIHWIARGWLPAGAASTSSGVCRSGPTSRQLPVLGSPGRARPPA